MKTEACSSAKLLHSLEALLSGLLSLLRIVGVVDGGLETASDVVGILVALALASRLEVAGVEDLWRSENSCKGGITYSIPRGCAVWTPQRCWGC